MEKLILATAIAASFNAHAAMDAKLIVGLGSYHFDKDCHDVLNEVNPAIGFEAWDVQAVYVSKNSWGKKSLYLTYSPDYKINDYFTVGANLGIATGYKCSNHAENERIDLAPINCSNSGVVGLGAVTVDYSPLANDFALSVSIAPAVAMFSVAYNL